ARNLLARCCVESRPSMRTNHRASARPGRVQYAQRSNSRRCLSSGYPMANLTSKPPTAPPAANIAALAVISDEYREKSLEPISKPSEEDNEASELYEAEEVLGVVFPTDEDAALPLNPSKEALHEPASHIAA